MSSSSKGPIPPRWLNCPRKGQIIADKFVPFKTPLSSSFDSSVPEENRFYPSMLVSSLKSYKVKMGLWIDLTNTSRFYDKSAIEDMGIQYVKLECRGHGECPSDEQTNLFVSICNKFIASKPLEIIGVHCTHGFNRTGFLIMAYLVESFNWSVDAAQVEFSRARPPGVYKGDYLKELFKRFGDVADCPPAPKLPDWCNEEEDDADDDGNSVRIVKRRRKEFVKSNPTFMEGVPGVKPLLTQPKLSRIQQKCQEMCRWESGGFPGSQPVSMDVSNITFLAEKPYKVSWKADGTRYMMLIDAEIYFLDRDNSVFSVEGLTFPRRKAPDETLRDTLLDGEMIIDKVDGKDVPRYLVYDIIRFEGKEVGGTHFDRRLLCIKKEIIESRHAAMQTGRIDRALEPFSVRAKEFWDASCADQLLSPNFQKNLPHEVDGLIFQPVPDPYKCGQSPNVLKWKPPSLNSVDFKLIISREIIPGCITGSTGHLYVGSLDRPFSEIKINRHLRAYDKKIIECKFENNQWKFMRERTDKSFPNSYNTAMAVYRSIKNPVTDEYLLNFIARCKQSAKRKNNQELKMPPAKR